MIQVTFSHRRTEITATFLYPMFAISQQNPNELFCGAEGAIDLEVVQCFLKTFSLRCHHICFDVHSPTVKDLIWFDDQYLLEKPFESTSTKCSWTCLLKTSVRINQEFLKIFLSILPCSNPTFSDLL